MIFMVSQMNKKILLIAIISTVTACASDPDDIDASYVSPLKYRNYDCEQLALEMDYVGQRAAKLYQRLDSEYSKDSWQMGVGLVLLWPTLFFLEGGDGPEASEYAQLKGEYKALHENAITKKCSIETKSPEEIIKEKSEEGS